MARGSGVEARLGFHAERCPLRSGYMKIPEPTGPPYVDGGQENPARPYAGSAQPPSTRESSSWSTAGRHGSAHSIQRTGTATHTTRAFRPAFTPTKSAWSQTESTRHRTQALGNAVQAGTLDRGLRQVLSYHVIFHWNRLGLSMRGQSVLAWAARAAILHNASET